MFQPIDWEVIIRRLVGQLAHRKVLTYHYQCHARLPILKRRKQPHEEVGACRKIVSNRALHLASNIQFGGSFSVLQSRCPRTQVMASCLISVRTERGGLKKVMKNQAAKFSLPRQILIYKPGANANCWCWKPLNAFYDRMHPSKRSGDLQGHDLADHSVGSLCLKVCQHSWMIRDVGRWY